MGRRRAPWLAVALLALASLAAAPAAARLADEPVRPPRPGVPVLSYHHFAIPEQNAVISPARFEAQLAWLREHGYRALGLRELLAYVRGRGRVPPRAVVITLDDGYESQYRVAYPLLRRYGMRAVYFPVGRWLGERAPGLPHFPWAQAREMVASGVVEVHAHTFDLHRRDPRTGQPLLEVLDPQAALLDLMRDRLAILDRLGTNAFALAYPYGRAGPRSRELARQAGFRLAFAQHPGRVLPGDDPYLLPRLVVPGGIPLAEFARLVRGEPGR